MRDISFFTKIYVATEPVDFRKHAHGLALVVEHHLGLDHLSEKSLFVFTNRRRSSIKLLYWDRSGFALWWKALEADQFRWPQHGDSTTVHIAPRELKWLLDGIDISSLKPHKNITFSS